MGQTQTVTVNPEDLAADNMGVERQAATRTNAEVAECHTPGFGVATPVGGLTNRNGYRGGRVARAERPQADDGGHPRP